MNVVTHGLDTNIVFGSGDNACDSIVNHPGKKPTDPGITTYDINSIYTPTLKNTIPAVYRRNYKKKKK